VHLEAWFDDALSASGTKATIVDASTGIVIRSLDGGEGDPHIWHDPRNARKMIVTMRAAFVAADPAGASVTRRPVAGEQVVVFTETRRAPQPAG
jgi:ABC-type Zn uptake system ZnuABC Zn-binding protein ZnuA